MNYFRRTDSRTALYFSALLLIVCCMTAAGVRAQSAKTGDWESALPSAVRYDWVQTTSGEWLKGELKAMYSQSLEFDSKEFNLQTLDWDDVAQFLGHGTMRVSIDTPTGYRTLNGVVKIDREWVSIASNGRVERYARNLLISITPGAFKETDNWSGRIGIGLNYSRGNTDQTDRIGSLLLSRRTPENRLIVNYFGNFSETNDKETVNNQRLNAVFDTYPDRQYFWRPLFLELYRDPFQNIDLRSTFGVGAGYHLIDKPDTTWNISGGPAYRLIRYDSVQSEDDDEASTPALVLSTFFDKKLSNEVDFKTLYNASIVNQESGTYTHYVKATFKIDLTSILDFDISLVWDRTRDPQPRSDGSLPDQDDYQWLLTLGVKI